MRLSHLIVVYLLALAPGCASGRGAKSNLSAESKEHQLLSDSARLYWEAVRWTDSERAGAFIEDAELRVLYRDWLEEHIETHKMEDAKILQAVLGPEQKASEDGWLQTGTVYIRTKGYSYPAQIVENDRVTQGWYRSVNGWFVDWQLPEADEEDSSPGWR